MIKKITLDIAGEDVELTLDEARQLMLDLKQLFPDQPIFPKYSPIPRELPINPSYIYDVTFTSNS